MGFAQQKRDSLLPQKGKALSTFLLALFTAACIFLPYVLNTEGYFTLYGDFNVQQIPFYKQCHAAIQSGNIFWDFKTDLGANFIGSYSFYLLGSPFFWITLLFPNNFVPYLMAPLLVLKFACAALTAYFYIRRFTRTPEAARLGGLLYAFSGFSIFNIFFNHFHEAIIVFPLLLLALELLITENRRMVFALAVCLCAVVNYFFFYGMVIFVIIYFFVRLCSGSIKVPFSRFLVIVFEAVMGLLLSAFILLPSLAAIIGNGRLSDVLLGWNAIMYGKEQIYANIFECFFFPPDIPARPVFFPGADVKWSSLGGWLPVFSMVGVFTWFKTKTSSWIKRVIGICIFMALVPILNSAFYAFNYAYYARWYYMPILLMCLATVHLTEENDVNWGFGYGWVLGITLAISAVIGFFPQKNSEGEIIFGLFTQSSDNTYKIRFFIACAIAIGSLVVLAILLKVLKSNKKAFYKAAVISVCIISIIYGNVYIESGREHSYEIKDVMIDSLIEGKVDFDDNSEFRIDTYDCVDNTGMYLGYSTINAFHSVVPASVMEFYEYIGVERSVASRPDENYPAIRPLLSVKYLLNREDGDSFIDEDTGETVMDGYTYVDSQGGYYIYKNDNYIPYGFSYNYYMSEEFCDEYPEDERASLMLKAMLLDNKQIEKYKGLLKNINGITDDSNDQTALLFGYENMQYDCKELSKTAAYYFKTDKRGFTAKVKRDRENLVFFSIPYDKGWTATVNGEPCEIEKVNKGFMAVKVPNGDSEIRFDYTTPYLREGFLITSLSALILAIYSLVCLIYTRKHKAPYNYPEGEILIRKWEKDEEEDEKRYAVDDYYGADKIMLDELDSLIIPKIDKGFNGGFKISDDKNDRKP